MIVADDLGRNDLGARNAHGHIVEITNAGSDHAALEGTWGIFLAGGKPLTVLPGMVGTAEIRTGRRSVLSFLLRPMMKATEAFTER